jgi:hypothetical protein
MVNKQLRHKYLLSIPVFIKISTTTFSPKILPEHNLPEHKNKIQIEICGFLMLQNTTATVGDK